MIFKRSMSELNDCRAHYTNTQTVVAAAAAAAKKAITIRATNPKF